MNRRLTVFVVAGIALMWAAVASAQQVVTGTVTRIDPGDRVIVFDNGQMVQTGPGTVILLNNQPVGFDTLTPGTMVVVQSGQPVVYQDGRYVVITQTAPGAVTSGTAVAAVPPPPPAQPVTVVQPTTAVTGKPAAYEVSGKVYRADATDHVIIFDDGRNVWLNPDDQVLANGQPAQLSTLKPGTDVTVRSWKPIAARGKQYATLKQVAEGTVVRVDPPGTLVLSDGRTIATTADYVVYMNGQPVAVTGLQPGSRVIVYQYPAPSYPSASAGAVYPGSGIRQYENERQAK
jgi:hypothetical protein